MPGMRTKPKEWQHLYSKIDVCERGAGEEHFIRNRIMRFIDEFIKQCIRNIILQPWNLINVLERKKIGVSEDIYAPSHPGSSQHPILRLNVRETMFELKGYNF